MLNINSELLENINTSNLLPINNDTYEVKTIIEEYQLENDGVILNTIDNQYEIVTKFIVGLYLEKYSLPDDVKVFLQKSHNYRIFLLSSIKDRMKSIIEESSVHLFKEIYIILNLLSNGYKYNLLTEDNDFSIKNLQELLNDYENSVCEEFIKNDKQNFELTFQYYLTLLEVLNGICVINVLDIKRKKNINAILELISNTIINIKNKIELEDIYIESLDAILGKLLLYFTNMSYISIDTNNKDIVIQKYAFMLSKINNGYELLNKQSKYYVSFLDKMTTLILTLMYKLKTKLHIKNIEFSESKNIEEIYTIYNKNVELNERIESTNLNDFREKLLLNYKFIYSKTTDNSLYDNQDLISFITTLEKISNVDMLVIHNIILFSEEIQKEKLDTLIKCLLQSSKFDNDYYEFYKLKIIDRVLQKYISLRIDTTENSFIHQIIKYIEQNNLASHLMSMYSKIYLSLSLYYSYEKSVSSQEESKKFYFIYQGLDENNFLDKEFNSISKQILYNYAKNYFNLFNFKSKSSFTSIELVQIGRDLVNKFIKLKELENRNESLLFVENLITEILEINEPNENWLHIEIEKLVSHKIFFGLVKAKIEHKNDTLNILEVGYEYIVIEIDEDYDFKLYYSSYYKQTVEKILQKEKEFISLVVKNIFKSYINSIPSYTDIVTKLPNINKLKNELNILDTKEITFFEVYLNTLVTFSDSYNIKTSNQLFKVIADKLNEEVDVYRLFGPKIGIILEEGKDYKELVSFLQNLKVTFENEEFELKPTIAVSIGKAHNILDKSFYSLSSAKISNDKLYIFE